MAHLTGVGAHPKRPGQGEEAEPQRMGAAYTLARLGKQQGLAAEVAHTHPFETVCLPLSYSGNPGVNGVSDRGVNGRRSGQD